METKKNYINGQWVLSVTERKREIICPSNGEIIAYTTESNEADAKAAIKAAREAFYVTGEWRRMSGTDRADYLYQIADEITARGEELARTDTLDNGKPLREAQGDVSDAAACFKYYAGLITKPQGGVYEVNNGFGPMHSYTVHEPVGVCAQITPWNYPLLMAVWKLAPALAAGNCIVFKPSENAPLSTVLLFEIFEKVGLPKGTVNLVLGTGPEVGAVFAESEEVDMITFTGSTKTGQSIMKAAAGNLKKIGLELGGKSPNIVFADCDFEGAIEWAMIGIFFNSGQVCSAGSRLIIEDSIKDKFLARLKERAEAITIGPGLLDPDMGAIITKAQMEKVLGYIQSGIQEGAVLVCGGERYMEGECAKGFFIKPTIFDHCTREMKIVREEIFGPVLTVQTFKTEEEAIALANDTPYGLAGTVCTLNSARALRVMKEIRAGIMWINCCQPTFNEAPWGGYKMSGIGRELGVHGLEEYQEVKQVNIALETGPIGWFMH
ncbi:aldehyde dehydrogenase family protein [Anaerocolumna sp. AGMB13025]|uniref:aldehyde dehydrogenase family protein n=1 Tax=Anaerocolumna sp. AGMB13025 TaxID=3039116 RepID=UPI00241F832C|nr:aldehyde dehydrogenase family protein [Anaerocolumna sp. AGMB13025]WFR58291.1 aldehyde dehydrogenase family protein [Anaerocolumna sp. AGMB13025]